MIMCDNYGCMKQHWKGFVLLSVIVLFFCACGNKKAPKTPGQTAIPVVEDVRAVREDGQIVLQWMLGRIEANVLLNLEGFSIFRASSDPALAGCKACPLSYEKIGDVYFEGGGQLPRTWSFVDLPPAGFVYFYNIRCYSADGRTGSPSRTVSVLVPKDGVNMGDN